MIRRLEGSATVALNLSSLVTSSVFPLLQLSRVRNVAHEAGAAAHLLTKKGSGASLRPVGTNSADALSHDLGFCTSKPCPPPEKEAPDSYPARRFSDGTSTRPTWCCKRRSTRFEIASRRA